MRRFPGILLRLPVLLLPVLLMPGCGEPEPMLRLQIRSAENYLDAGRVDSAITLLQQARDQAGDRVDILEPLAFAYSAKDDPAMAALTFSRIAELVPEQPEYLLYAATSLLQAGDRKGAIARYREYLQRSPDDRAIWVTLADLHSKAGNTNKALEAFLAAERIEPRSAQQLSIGQLYLKANNLPQAQRWFARAADASGDLRPKALLGLLETAVRAGRFSDAEALLQQIDQEFPGTVDQSPIASVRPQLRQWRQRQEAAREAVQELADSSTEQPPPDQPPPSAPEQPSPDPSGRPQQPERSPDPQPAGQESAPSDSAQAASTTDPASTSPTASTSTPAQPAQAAEPAQTTEPAQPAQAAEAAEAAQAAEAVDPEVSTDSPEPSDHLQAARRMAAQKKWPEAIGHYRKALLQDDRSAAVWAELSEAYLAIQNHNWARATASEARRREPDNPRWQLQFLRAAQPTLSTDQFLAELENAHRRFPEFPRITLVLARAYDEAGNQRNARLLYEDFLNSVGPDHPERSSVQERLQLLAP